MTALRDAVVETVRKFWADDPFRMAAALAYYTLLSLAPLLLVVVGVAGLLFGQLAARQALLRQAHGYLGAQGAHAVTTLLSHAPSPGASELSIVIGLGATLLGATTAFAQLQAAMNDIWGVTAVPGRGASAWQWLRRRLMALGMVVLIGLLLALSLLVSTVAAGVSAGGLASRLPELMVPALNSGFSSLLSLVLIASTVRYLPDAEVAWRDAWAGALMATLLLAAGRYLIDLYLRHAAVSSVFGAAGSVVVLMVWIDYASLILFLGAEFTCVLGRRRLAAG